MRPRLVETDVYVGNARGGRNPGPLWIHWLRKQVKRRRVPLIVVVSEADGGRFRPFLLGLAARFYAGASTHGAREVGILILGLAGRVLTSNTMRLTANVSPSSVDAPGWYGPGHDRWVTEIVYRRHGTDFAVLSTHAPSAMVAKHSGHYRRPLTPGAHQWTEKGLPRLADRIRHHDQHGRIVILGLDANAWDRGDASLRAWVDAEHLPVRVVAVTGVMWALVSTRLPAARIRITGRAPDTDHPHGIAFTLRTIR